MSAVSGVGIASGVLALQEGQGQKSIQEVLNEVEQELRGVSTKGKGFEEWCDAKLGKGFTAYIGFVGTPGAPTIAACGDGKRLLCVLYVLLKQLKLLEAELRSPLLFSGKSPCIVEKRVMGKPGVQDCCEKCSGGQEPCQLFLLEIKCSKDNMGGGNWRSCVEKRLGDISRLVRLLETPILRSSTDSMLVLRLPANLPSDQDLEPLRRMKDLIRGWAEGEGISVEEVEVPGECWGRDVHVTVKGLLGDPCKAAPTSLGVGRDCGVVADFLYTIWAFKLADRAERRLAALLRTWGVYGRASRDVLYKAWERICRPAGSPLPGATGSTRPERTPAPG